MFQPNSIIIRLTLISLLSIGMSAGSVAQTPAPGAASSRRGKSNKQTCDGALDIVPVKAVTFVRKRRPAPKEQPAAPGVSERRPEKR
ncbi:MAG: hypothetical protein ACKVX9_08365 [Blastocatellia bacterium]